MNLDNQFQEFEWTGTITRCVRYFPQIFHILNRLCNYLLDLLFRLQQAGVLNGEKIRTDQVYEGKLTQIQYFC